MELSPTSTYEGPGPPWPAEPQRDKPQQGRGKAPMPSAGAPLAHNHPGRPSSPGGSSEVLPAASQQPPPPPPPPDLFALAPASPSFVRRSMLSQLPPSPATEQRGRGRERSLSLERQRGAAGALTRLCTSLTAIAREEGEVLDADDAVMALCAILRARAPGVAASAANALAELMEPMSDTTFSENSASERLPQQQALSMVGGIDLLIEVLKANDDGAERSAAAHALRNACDRNVANCDAVRDAGGLELLRAMLKASAREQLGAEASEAELRERLHEEKAIQFYALATLGCLAASNDANRVAIQKLDIIAQLVNMTTDPRAHAQAAEEERRASEADEGGGGSAAQGEGGASGASLLKITSSQLANAAGEVLSSMLAKGDKSIEVAIVQGIVAAVRNQGARPPTAFPELMAKLQLAARERLQKCQAGNDAAALELALDFGRWIKLPTVLLGIARNEFKKLQMKALKAEQAQLRRVEFGLKRTTPAPTGAVAEAIWQTLDTGAPGASPPPRGAQYGASPPSGSAAAAAVAAAGGGGGRGGLSPPLRTGSSAALRSRAMGRQAAAGGGGSCARQAAWSQQPTPPPVAPRSAHSMPPGVSVPLSHSLSRLRRKPSSELAADFARLAADADAAGAAAGVAAGVAAGHYSLRTAAARRPWSAGPPTPVPVPPGAASSPQLPASHPGSPPLPAHRGSPPAQRLSERRPSSSPTQRSSIVRSALGLRAARPNLPLQGAGAPAPASDRAGAASASSPSHRGAGGSAASPQRAAKPGFRPRLGALAMKSAAGAREVIAGAPLPAHRGASPSHRTPSPSQRGVAGGCSSSSPSHRTPPSSQRLGARSAAAAGGKEARVKKLPVQQMEGAAAGESSSSSRRVPSSHRSSSRRSRRAKAAEAKAAEVIAAHGASATETPGMAAGHSALREALEAYPFFGSPLLGERGARLATLVEEHGEDDEVEAVDVTEPLQC